MYCRNCGTALADDAKFCLNCGTPTASSSQAVPQPPAPEAAPAQPAPEAAPVQPAPAGTTDVVASVNKIMHFIVGGVAVWALIMGILNLFGLYSVSVTASSFFGSISIPVAVSSIYSESVILLIGNILYGLACLAIAGVGTLYFLKVFQKMDLYDKFVGKFVNPLLGKFVAGDGIATLIGIVGAAFGILQLLFFIIAGYPMHFTSWLSLIVYAAMAACDLFWLNKKKA